MRKAQAVLAVAIACAAAGPARADGESALSVAGAWMYTSHPGEDDMDVAVYAGGTLALEYERAFAESLSWRVELVGGLFFDDGTAWVALGDAGAVYRFDVTKYVPYAFAGVGAVGAGGGPLETGFDPVLVLGGGLDFLRGRDRSWGFEGRLASFAGDVTTFSVGLRYTLRWGYF